MAFAETSLYELSLAIGATMRDLRLQSFVAAKCGTDLHFSSYVCITRSFTGKRVHNPRATWGERKNVAANYAFANCRHGFVVANVHLAATTLLPLSVAVFVVGGDGGGGGGGDGDGGGGGLFIVVCFYLFCLQLPKSSCAKCIIISS